MKRLAAVDIGTNTALLLIAEAGDNREIQPLFQQERIVRLGEGVDENRTLKEVAIARTVRAVEDYVAAAKQFGATEFVITGTSAIRDAMNRNRLIDQINKRFAMEMRVLSGEEEARLTYFGALSNKQHLDGEIILFDIGGGSTECIFGTRDSLQSATSLDIGSVRLTERFVRNDPISDDEFANMQNYVRQQIKTGLSRPEVRPKHFVGVAGTVTTLAAIDLKLESYDGELVDNRFLTVRAVTEVVKCLRRKNLEEKRRIKGLAPGRADVILAGATILLEFMHQFGVETVVVSDRGLRFGLVVEALARSA